ncbi:hypothetical protein [Shimazuella kribbensis]|uniref:hypothetical protein n=1 Tax=Shimazuella kribbensis TaxID=139808 RepID=UPI0003FC5CF7|nr:hypothetical protein [Shimazuella kribbensis]
MNTLQINDSQSSNPFLSWISRWPIWVAYAAAIWSFIYGIMGLYWMMGGIGFPFGEGDPVAEVTILNGLRAETGAPCVMILGFAGTTIAFAMARLKGKGMIRALLITFSVFLFIMLAFIIPDARVMITIAYMPIFIVGAPFDFPPVSFWDYINWSIINQFILVLGGLLWAATGLTYYRRSEKACGYCGRLNGNTSQWLTSSSAAKWGKWFVYAGFGLPFVYSISRIAWALGYPLGITEAFLHQLQANGLVYAGLGLAILGLGGGVLILGLIQRWGEVFPRWIPFFAGKRVPPALAIIPALLVATALGSLGSQIFRQFFMSGDYKGFFNNPVSIFPIWGLILYGATIAYYYRRRGQCKHCQHDA